MNKVILCGNITNDLELRQTTSGKNVLGFTVALNEGYGEKKTTEFVDCTAWENTAEVVAKYCHKGSKLLVEGKIRSDSYEKNGEKRKKVYVLVDRVELLDQKESPPVKKTITTKPQWSQPTLADDGRDVTGHIESEALPFY